MLVVLVMHSVHCIALRQGCESMMCMAAEFLPCVVHRQPICKVDIFTSGTI